MLGSPNFLISKVMSESNIDQLKKDPLLSKAISKLESVHGSPLPNEIQRFLLDQATASELRVENTVDWVRKTLFITNKIINSEANESDYPLFWIYLNEIVDRFYKHEDSTREINEQIPFKKPILDCLDSMRAKLSDEEIIFIQFMRNSHCHMHLRSLWTYAKMVNEELKISKEAPTPDPREIAENIIQSHEGSQKKTAIHFAKLSFDDLEKLQVAVSKAIGPA